MKTLNLVYLERSNIKYRVDKFPDGQSQIIIEGVRKFDSINTNKFEDFGVSFITKREVQIKSRLNNFQDLELIICATKSLRNLGVKEIHLYTPYFLGSRSDRQFEQGSNNYLKDVICPIINSLEFESVTVMDSHSNVLEACLNNFKKLDNRSLVDWSLKDIDGPKRNWRNDEIILVSPDDGASKKIYKLVEQIGYKVDVVICSKNRDKDGKLTETSVNWNKDHKLYNDKDFIIIDDICDGGKTFINIAEIIKAYHSNSKIYLIVTHGIFSKGFDELSKYFDGIYCTNSYSDIYEIKDRKVYQPVEQLNIF